LYQCINFLAANEATIGLASHPDDPCKNRMTITINGDIAAVEYPCDEEIDFLNIVLSPVCRALCEHAENKAKEAD
jgi:hypothetical protein